MNCRLLLRRPIGICIERLSEFIKPPFQLLYFFLPELHLLFGSTLPSNFSSPNHTEPFRIISLFFLFPNLRIYMFAVSFSRMAFTTLFRCLISASSSVRAPLIEESICFLSPILLSQSMFYSTSWLLSLQELFSSVQIPFNSIGNVLSPAQVL